MNYYETLKVPQTASQDEIKSAYRKLAKEYHPDKNSGEDTKHKFQQLQEAYAVLGDNNKRREYDNKNTGPSLEDIFNNYWSFGNNFSQDFDTHFGGFRNNPNAKGQDIRVTVPITIDEIYNGFSRSIDVGTGRITANIPKGAREGSKYKMAGKGQPNPFNSNAPAGDLIININLQYDENYIIQGDDVMIESFVKFYDMILGTNLEVKIPSGKISIKIPENTTPGKLLRVPGKGLPISGTNNAGALLIKVNTNFQNLNTEQLALIHKIKELN